MAVAATVNANRKRKQPYPVTDFLPTWSKAGRQEQTPEEMFAAITRANAAFGGQVNTQS